MPKFWGTEPRQCGFIVETEADVNAAGPAGAIRKSVSLIVGGRNV